MVTGVLLRLKQYGGIALPKLTPVATTLRIASADEFQTTYPTSKISVMKLSIKSIYILLAATLASTAASSQNSKVVITGVRFSYPLVNAWIDAYKKINPSANIVIEPRTTTDPSQYDLLIEAYEPDSLLKETRDFVDIGRYALLPVANAQSGFAKEFGNKGLTKELIKQIYFQDAFADKKKERKINSGYTVYTRLQKAGVPITLAKYFGFEQGNIKGKAIAGADEHLIKAVLKDSTAITYATLGLVFDLKTRNPLTGLTILPVDLDDNGKIQEDEKIFNSVENVLSKLETDDVKNVPIERIHLSIAKKKSNVEALKFLQWILNNGRDNLHEFGFLNPDEQRFKKEKEKLLKQLSAN
jgi:phosphate transport system substrate-binding protein